MAKVRFSELSDDEPTPFDGLHLYSPSGYNRFSTPSPEPSEPATPSAGASAPTGTPSPTPMGMAPPPDESTSLESGNSVVDRPPGCA